MSTNLLCMKKPAKTVSIQKEKISIRTCFRQTTETAAETQINSSESGQNKIIPRGHSYQCSDFLIHL